MAIELRWLASLSASAFHAANALVQQRRLVDEDLTAALAEPAQMLMEEVESIGIDGARALDLLAALAMGIENNRELVEVMITKLKGRSDSMGENARRVAGRVADVEAVFKRTLPDVVDQLTLRGEPLKQLWDARGPGLLTRIGQLTDASLIVKEADVALVYPVLGGNGIAHLPFNSVRIEAVLANPHERLPEVLRLGWLLAQLNLDVPIHGEQVPRERLPHIAALAMLPAALDAAEYVEFPIPEQNPLAQAIRAWRVVEDETDAQDTADIVANWWRTYQESSVPMRVALGSLNVMLTDVVPTSV